MFLGLRHPIFTLILIPFFSESASHYLLFFLLISWIPSSYYTAALAKLTHWNVSLLLKTCFMDTFVCIWNTTEDGLRQCYQLFVYFIYMYHFHLRITLCPVNPLRNIIKLFSIFLSITIEVITYIVCGRCISIIDIRLSDLGLHMKIGITIVHCDVCICNLYTGK